MTIHIIGEPAVTLDLSARHLHHLRRLVLEALVENQLRERNGTVVDGGTFTEIAIQSELIALLPEIPQVGTKNKSQNSVDI